MEKHSGAFTEELMQLDAAIDLFDRNDQEGVKQDMRQAQNKLDSLDEFVVELSEKRQEMEGRKKQWMPTSQSCQRY